jgi:hypothetical protein
MASRSRAVALVVGLRIAAVLVLAGMTILLVTTTALAYGPVQGNSTGSTSATSVGPGGTIRFVATFRDQFNQPPSPPLLANFFQQNGPAGCTAAFAPTSATTDANGQVASNVTFPANCPGGYVLAASAGGVTVTAAVNVSGGFADTSALPQAVGAGDWSSWGSRLIALGVVLVLIGALGYRFRTRRARAAESVEEPAWPTTSEPVGSPRER